MKNKTKLSRRIMKVKSTDKYFKMKDKLEELESSLQESYISRRLMQEKKAISKMKRIQDTSLPMPKSSPRQIQMLGPFWTGMDA